tara:strand:- start:611 stop:868 length:258 start_codon:yes stop_codon:yes gene_type:complete
MKITKELKYATFSYDEEGKAFTITEEDGSSVTLNKIYSFAFMRFVVRIAQRNWLRTKRPIPKTSGVAESNDVEEEYDPNQLMMFK